MRLVVLGRYSPFAPADGAGLGYWVESDQGGFLLECGPGVLSSLQKYVGPLAMVRTVLLSHLHFDHASDILVLRYAASPDGRYVELPQKVTVYAPGHPELEFSLLRYREVIEPLPITSGSSLAIGDLTVTFFPVEHPVPSYAMRIQCGSKVLAYSGDTRPCPGLLEAARGADLFLCEASGLEKDADFCRAGHLTSVQAGLVAREAGVKKLLLTHIWPFYRDEQLLEECRRAFSDSMVAKEGSTYEV